MSEYYLGNDLHKRRSYVVLMDGKCNVMNEGCLTNDAMNDHLKERVPRTTTAVLEATWN